MLLEWREPTSLASELAAATITALLIGLSFRPARGELFRGVFRPPFERLSAAIDYKSAPAVGSLGSLAIGAVASASGVRVFTQEKSTQEFQSGQSRSAYYLGETLATMHRMCASSLHMTALVCVLGMPRMGFAQMYLADVMYFWGIYGQADLLVVLLPIGSRWAGVVSLMLAVFGGFSPWPTAVSTWHLEWLWRCSPAAWYTEAYAGRIVCHLDHLYDLSIAQVAMGYELHQYGRDVAMMFVIGLVYRLLAWAGGRRWKNVS